MSESSVKSVEDVNLDLADQAINDLMKEAEMLMQDLPLEAAEAEAGGSEPAPASDGGAPASTPSSAAPAPVAASADVGAAIGDVGGNFSIDDEDDEDDFRGSEANGIASTGAGASGVGATEVDDPLRAAASPPPAKSPSMAQKVFRELEQDHPLSALSLGNTTKIPLTEPGSTKAAVPPATPSPSMGSTMSNLFQQGSHGMGGVLHNKMHRMGSAGEAAASGMDTFSKTTSMFASNLASMAQRGMAHVAAAAAPVQAVSVMGAPGTMAGQGGQPPMVSPAMGTGHGVVSGPGGPQAGAGPGSNPQGHPQLDKDQKIGLLKKHVGPLLKGEQLIMFLTNLLHVSDTSGLSYVATQQQQASQGGPVPMWCGVMTYYRLILFSTADRDSPSVRPMEAPRGWDPNCWKAATPRIASVNILEMPLASMDRVEKTVYQASGSSYMGLIVHGKDCGRKIQFSTSSYVDTSRAFESLNTYAFPGRRNLGYLFAFESKRQAVQDSIKVDEASGHQGVTLPPTPKRFDPMTEFPRLLKKTAITQPPWALWAAANANYQLSQSYPSVLVGPASLDETKPEALRVIRQCAAFRKAQRLPSMSWCGVGGASIWRSSQPKVGLQGNRSPADELYVRHIIESARGANAMAEPPPIYPRGVLEQLTGDYTASSGGKGDDWLPEPGCGLKILDLRPRAAAMGNRTAGYGYENTSNYSNTTLKFTNIQNIHAVRDSYEKLCTVCNSISTADVHWNSLIEDTKWLSHIRTILAASWETAYWVHVWRLPILVHCSHGWDRTSQTVCLSQLLLDSYYRTRHGFSVLVEKDFMSFGHPFHLRSAHGEGRSDTKNAQSNDVSQISPVFLQFLDCVYQLVELYPSAFEFNTQYLLDLSFHIYSCRFGNMLCDTERERESMAAIRQRTYSVWDYLETKPENLNQNYAKADDAILMPLPTLLRNVKVWKERHLAYCPKTSTMAF